MLLDAEESQLVLVDYQIRLMPAIHDNAAVIANATRLARLAQILSVPAWGTEQNPASLGGNLPGIRELCGDTLAKMEFSACAAGLTELLRPPVLEPQRQGGNARSLPKHLRKPPQEQAPRAERNGIVIAGCEAHVCLLQTALDLIDEEFEVWVVTDACGSRTERNRDAAFDRLAGAGAELVTTEMVACEWLRKAEHPGCRQGQALIQ